MTRRGVQRSLTITAIMMGLGVPAALSYTLLSPARHWAGIPVVIQVTTPGHVSIDDADGGVASTVAALNGTHPLLAGTGWNVGRTTPVVQAMVSSQRWALGDGVPTIAFDEKLKGTCSGSCLAATFTGYYNCTSPLPDGHCLINDADVETRRNKADRSGGPYYSLYEPCARGKEWNIEAIMVHEVGHVLGLGHSDVSGATMYPSVSSCNTEPATIEGDDAAALDVLYPH